jgi:hypothetical protein
MLPFDLAEFYLLGSLSKIRPPDGLNPQIFL